MSICIEEKANGNLKIGIEPNCTYRLAEAGTVTSDLTLEQIGDLYSSFALFLASAYVFNKIARFMNPH